MSEDVPKMSLFVWTKKREKAALLLSQGYNISEAAAESGVSEKTVDRWKKDIEFAAEVDRLSLMVDIAGRAHRLRLAMRIARKIGEKTDKDLLEWLKYAQSETDGVRFDAGFSAFLQNALAVAGRSEGGSDGPESDENTTSIPAEGGSGEAPQEPG